MLKNLIGWLLNLANALRAGERFYVMKTKILFRYGRFTGLKWQLIRHECHNCSNQQPNYRCQKCGGSGTYRWGRHVLLQYQVGRHTFHKPTGHTWNGGEELADIIGKITHPHPGAAGYEALLLLALFFDRPLFKWFFTSFYRPGFYLYPLANLQRLYHLARRIRWQLIHKFPVKRCRLCLRIRLLRGVYCHTCSDLNRRLQDMVSDEMPF